MPLRAIQDTKSIHAFDFNSIEWAKLKTSCDLLNLKMPCCGNMAIPKTSSLGTPFFAHNRRGNCTSAPESPEHLRCKQIIAEAALASGWTAVTEKPGLSPSGEAWIADVFCEKGTATIAFEVQLSPQTQDETMRRQIRYKDSGIRSAWFFGQKLRLNTENNEREMPIFRLTQFDKNKEPIIEKYGFLLSEFVKIMLNKKLVWARSSHVTPFYLGYFRIHCRKCNSQNKLILSYAKATENTYDTSISDDVTSDSIGNALGILYELIKNDELKYLGFASIHKVYGNRKTYYVNQYCRKCSNSIIRNDDLANWVNRARYGSTSTTINEDGEVVDHPLMIARIDLSNDDYGYWTIEQ